MTARRTATKDNRVVCALFLLFAAQGFSPTAFADLAGEYPGDEGLENDPRVLFLENFEATTVAQIRSRYTSSNEQGMAISVDRPAESSGSQSLSLDSSQGNAFLYRNLSDTPNQLYVRNYMKHQSNKVYHHLGAWYGSYNSPTSWAQGRAGERTPPTHFSVGAEEAHGPGQTTGSEDMRFGFYNYWPGMSPDAHGTYWGAILPSNGDIRVPTDEWVCIETMIKLDEPVGARNGELALWINGELIVHFKPGSPIGYWNYARYFLDPNGAPFEGIDWRGNDPDLTVNWLWILNHPAGEVAQDLRGKIWIDDVVVATEYIGPISNGPPTRQKLGAPGIPRVLP